MIELVIKIPEDSYKATCSGSMLPPDVKNVINAIRNGTLLPKGHGSLKDADALGTSIENRYADMELDGYDPLALGTYADMVDDLVETAPTIIDADKEAEE